MAKRNVKQDAMNGDDAPEGFVSVLPDKVEGFFKPEAGATIQGYLLGRYKSRRTNRNGKDRFYYQIRTTKPCKAQVKVDDEYVTNDFDPPAIISVDESAALKSLEGLANQPDKAHEVWLKVVEKMALDDGNSFWKYDVRAKEVSRDSLDF